jgi:ATP-dependent DNA helicase HFM1/MER3
MKSDMSPFRVHLLATTDDFTPPDSFDASYRPVPLTVHVIGQGFVGEESNQQFRFWSGLNRHVAEILVRFSNNKPAIVFCHSKADAEKLADLLANANGICQIGNGNQAVASQAKITKLQRVLFRGVAFHHAGLEIEDRRVVERAFSQGKIRALCATSTLAMGVNLPAHLVVIKGTKVWRGPGSGYQDLESASLVSSNDGSLYACFAVPSDMLTCLKLQMIGRAGRPGFDTEGTAVIMTDNKSKAVFQRLASSGLKSAKSQLVKKLDEVLNTEISQGVITSLESAMNWMKGTLYFEQLKSDLDRELHVQDLCRSTIERLGEIGALQVSSQDYSVVPLAAGRIMVRILFVQVHGEIGGSVKLTKSVSVKISWSSRR